MKNRKMKTGLAALITVAMIVVGANALAGQGKGSGRDGQGRGGCIDGQRWSNLSAEQIEQMKAERQTFFDATRHARQDLYAKRLALKAEIAKSEPDMKVARSLQKEVSGIQADLDLKRLDHIMAMRKIDPDAGRGFLGEGCGRGQGGKRHHYGKSSGMGKGSDDCPFN